MLRPSPSRSKRSARDGQPAASWVERALIGLHCGAVAALALIASLAVWLGRGLELLPQNRGGGPGAWLAAWLGLALLIGLPRRARAAWRLGSLLCAGGWLLAAAAGVARGSALAVSGGALLLALGCAALALGLREGAPPVSATPSARSAPRPPLVQRAAQRDRGARERVATWAPWGLWLVSFVVCFAAAATGAGAARATGHAGMLLCFFVMLPALSLRPWFPRFAAAAWLLSALLLAALGVHAALWITGLIALPVAGCVLAWLPRRIPGKRALLDEAAE